MKPGDIVKVKVQEAVLECVIWDLFKMNLCQLKVVGCDVKLKMSKTELKQRIVVE